MLGLNTARLKQSVAPLYSGPRLPIYAAGAIAMVTAGYLAATDRHLWAVTLAALAVSPLLVPQRILLLKILSLLAPIYWLPFVPPALYEGFRDVLFLAFFVSVALAVATSRLSLKNLPHRAGIGLMAAFFLAMVPGVLISVDLQQSTILWLKAVQAGLFYVVLLLVVDTEEQVRQLLVLCMLGQLLSIGVLWLETASEAVGVSLPWNVPFAMYRYGRGELGLSFRRTAFSNSTAYILPVVFLVGLWRKATPKLIGFLAVAAAVGAIIISKGRAGLLAALVVVSVMVWSKSRSRAIALFIVILLVALALPSIVGDLIVSSPEWTYSVQGWQRYDRLLGGRINAYIAAAELMRSHPFFGVGLGDYARELKPFSSIAELGLDPYRASGAHNLYLHVGSVAGIPAALVLAALMIWVLHKALVALRSFPERVMPRVLSAIIIAQLVTSLFEVEIFWTIMRAFPFWIALAGIIKFYSEPLQPDCDCGQ